MEPNDAYRSADPAAVLAQKEKALADAHERIHELERWLVSTRARIKKQQAFGALQAGGLGALLGVIAGAIAWLALDAPFFMLGGASGGFLFTVILTILWTPPQDGGSVKYQGPMAGVMR